MELSPLANESARAICRILGVGFDGLATAQKRQLFLEILALAEGRYP